MQSEQPSTSNLDNFTSQIAASLLDKELSSHSCVTISDFRYLVEHTVASFVIKLYSNMSIPRNLVLQLISDINELYSTTWIEVLKQTYNCSQCTNSTLTINSMFDILQYAFANHKTEHATMKYLENSNNLIRPQSTCIDTSLCIGRIGKRKKTSVCKLVLQIIPMRAVMKKFLELPNVFNSIMLFIEEMKKSNAITSVM